METQNSDNLLNNILTQDAGASDKNPEEPSFFRKNKKYIFIGAGIFLLAIAAVAVWYFMPKKPAVPARFSLEATLNDSAGVNPKTEFVLKSSQSISAGDVKKIVKFDPPVDFTVQRTSGISAVVKNFFAQANPSTAESVYTIKPNQELSGSDLYKIQISDPAYADHEYSWAFQVKAALQVVQTHPGDKSNGAPINSGIEITFNRENLISPQDYFEITPKTQGTFELSGNTLVFLPNSLVEKTIYTVVMKKGVKSEGSEDVLAEDYSFSFETGEKAYTGTRPYFSLDNDFLEFVPDKKPAFGVYYYGLEPSALQANIYKFSGADEFLNAYQGSRKWEWGWTRFYREGYAGFDTTGRQSILSFKPIVISSGYQKFFEIPQALEKGYYLLDILVEGRHEQTWIQVTPLARYFSISSQKSFLWVYDFLKKEPISGLKTSFIGKSQTENLGSTNQDGLVEFATPQSLRGESSQSSEPSFLKVESGDYLPLIIKIVDSWGWRQQVQEGDLYWNYLSTDRQLYQMSDQIKYWGIAKGRNEDLKQKKVKVGLYSSFYYDPYYSSGFDFSKQQALAKQELLISQFDTVQGQLDFKGLSPGYYTVVLTLDDKVISTAGVQVMTYTKPAYQIVVTPSRQTMYAGETVNFKVEAKFFDGTPVEKLKLHYAGYWLSSFSGEITLDKNGVGNVSYTPQYSESNVYYPRHLDISFTPVNSEEGEISGSGGVLVFGPNIYLQASRKKISGNNYRFTAKLNKIEINNVLSDETGMKRYEYIGEPVRSYSLDARIIELTYLQVEDGQYYDPIDKVVRKTYHYTEQTSEIEKIYGNTDNAGEWSFERNLPTLKNGYYQVVFSTRDSGGRLAQSYAYAGYASYNQWKVFSFSLSIGDQSYSKEYSIGDKVELKSQITNGEKPAGAKVLFYRYQNNIDQISITSDLNFEETFRDEFSPSVQYRAVILGPYGFEETGSVTASLKREDKKLNISVNPEKDSYRPADEIKLNLSVTGKDNNPVAAEVNLSAIDEAMYHILPYNWRTNILDGLYHNISVWLLSGGTKFLTAENINQEPSGAERGGCFAEGTPILMADGSQKTIEKIKVGDEIMTFQSENSKILQPAVVQGISSHLVDGYLVINDSLKVTPEHRIFINDRWDYAGLAKIGDKLTRSDGQLETIFSIKQQQVKSRVYNIVVGKYHTFFADNYYVHNQEKGGGARSDFVDVAAYQTVQTGSDGRAQISFKAPDNITSWHVTALAFSSKTMQAGETDKLIPVSLPFFVDATLSNYYLTGDQPWVRLRAAGTNHDPDREVEYAVQNTELNLNQKLTSKDSNVFIQLGALTEGEHEIKISAKQGQYQDSLIKKIKVVNSYFKQRQSTTYELTADLTGIKGNENGYTDLLFIDTGRGKYYGHLWGNAYMSGIRSDQITANYFASQMLAQYFGEPKSEASLDLSLYQTNDGGMAFFPYGDNDLELSAKLADLAPEFVSQSSLAGYFQTALSDKKTDIHRVAKALYGLASLRQPVLVKINLVKNNPALNLEDKIYLGLALAKLGDNENARQIYNDSIRPQVKFQGPDGWLAQETDLTKRVKLTSAISVLASYLDVKGDKDMLWNYTSEHAPIRDLNMLEQIMIMKRELARLPEITTKFAYQIGSEQKSITLENGRRYSMRLSADDLQRIKFSGIEGNINLISFYEESADPATLNKNNELTLTRKYSVNGAQTNTFNEGDIVLVTLKPNFAPTALDGAYQVVDYLPSGLRLITNIWERGLSWGSMCNHTWYPSKVIDNAAYFYLYRSSDRNWYCPDLTINYYARVVSKGDYKSNPALLQSLKDLDSLNISSKDSVKIN